MDQEVVFLFNPSDTAAPKPPTEEEESLFWIQPLEKFPALSSQRLDASLESREVGNRVATVANTRSALTLTTWGKGICGPAHVQAGVQRLNRALPPEG